MDSEDGDIFLQSEWSEEDHKRKKGNYKYCPTCADAQRSEITFINTGHRNINWTPMKLISLNSHGRWEILRYRIPSERSPTFHVPYRELIKGKCTCAHCNIDLDGNYDCDWHGEDRAPIAARSPGKSVPMHKTKARARPEFAIIEESELVDVLKWEDLREVLPESSFPPTDRGRAIMASLRKIYNNQLETKGESAIILDFGKAQEENDDSEPPSDEREWIVIFSTKNHHLNGCTTARNYFISKLMKQNLLVLEIEVAASEYSQDGKDGRLAPCTHHGSRTWNRVKQHDRWRLSKGSNKHDPSSKKEITFM